MKQILEYVQVYHYENNLFQELASYLLYLASNESAYNEYFLWRDSGGVFWEDAGAHRALYCRLCALAHHSLGKYDYLVA